MRRALAGAVADSDHPRDHRPADLAATRPARTTCPPTTSSTTIYQNLLPVPARRDEAACPRPPRSCDFTDDTRPIECTIKPGLKFSDGSPLDAEDVVFSFERNVNIADPNGASSLLANMKSVEAPDDDTVVFHLKEPDATWPSVLTTGSFAIVPADSLSRRTSCQDDKVIGSGRYTLAAVRARPADRDADRTTTTRASDPAQERHGDHPVLRQGLGAEARASSRATSTSPTAASRPTDLDDLEERRRRQRRLRATAPRSATSSSTWTSSRATTTRRSWRSARPSRRRSTARRSSTTSTTAPSSRSTRWSRRASTYATERVQDEYGASPDVDGGQADPRATPASRRPCRSRSGTRRRTTGRPRPTSTPRSSASSTTAGSST